MPYGDAWRECRREFHQYFREKVVREYFPLQSMQSVKYLRSLCTHPEDFYHITKK